MKDFSFFSCLSLHCRRFVYGIRRRRNVRCSCMSTNTLSSAYSGHRTKLFVMLPKRSMIIRVGFLIFRLVYEISVFHGLFLPFGFLIIHLEVPYKISFFSEVFVFSAALPC